MTRRDRALLAAVGAGRAEITCSCEPDLLIDGCWCCDQPAAHRLAHAGLIAPVESGPIGQPVPAVLTDAGRRALEVSA